MGLGLYFNLLFLVCFIIYIVIRIYSSNYKKFMVFVLRNIVYLLLFDDMFNILKHSNYLWFYDTIFDFDVGGCVYITIGYGFFNFEKYNSSIPYSSKNSN